MVKVHDSLVSAQKKNASGRKERTGDAQDIEVSRFSLELPVQVSEILKQIQKDGGLRTRTEAIVASIALTEWMMRHAKNGRLITSLDPKNKRYTELDSPILTTARASANSRASQD